MMRNPDSDAAEEPRPSLIKRRWRSLFEREGGKARLPGVILLQIDGLSRYQCERALKAGRMPFLKSMVGGGAHRLRSFYPGQPSSTPAVQAEIMYGKRCVVPAFSFYDAERDEDCRMYGATWARRVAEIASRGAAPLLQGGSSYGNIYSGGAERFRYCGENNTLGYWLEEVSLFRLARFVARRPRVTAKVLRLCLIEVALAVRDCAKGLMSRGQAFAELKFIGARVGVSVALREAIRYRVSEDAKDGLPIIYANFFGYDEQAHRRGPQSAFAHWSLKGIDGALKKICRVARRKGARDYSIIVFSDHGQESVQGYEEAHGVNLETRVQQMFGDEGCYLKDVESLTGTMERARYAVKSALGRQSSGVGKRWIRVKAMGPTGHIYAEGGLSEEERRRWAARFVAEAGVSYVLFRDEFEDVRCQSQAGEGSLEVLREVLEKRGHPFTDEVIADLEIMAKTGYSGELILIGWRPNGKPLSFAEESGAHGGPGAEECRGFALLPRPYGRDRDWIRGLDLRDIAFELSGRCVLDTPIFRHHEHDEDERALQVASYNVHGGVGTDGRFDPDRVGDVARRLHVDVVCFQEAFEGGDVARSLEAALRRRWSEDLHYHFLPLHERDGIRYGLAMASIRPMRIVKGCGFDLTDARFARREPRGAQLVEFRVDGRRALVANTHFGLNAAERMAQAEALLSDAWMGNGVSAAPLALAGDFNAGPNSPPIRLFRERLQDAQGSMADKRAQATFLSWAPIRRIDHILASSHWQIRLAGAYQGPGTRVASDHLPVFADLRLAEEADRAK